MSVVGGHVMPVTGQLAVARSGAVSGGTASGGRGRRALRHRRCSAHRLRGAEVPSGTGSEATGHQVLVGRTPHRAGRLAPAPAGRALRAVASFIRLVSGQQRSPPRREAREFGTRHGQQGRRIRAIGELGQHIEPLPDRVAQNLSQHRVHRSSPSLSRLISGEPRSGLALSGCGRRRPRGPAGRPGENHPVPVDEHEERPMGASPVRRSDVPRLQPPSVVSRDRVAGHERAGFRSGDGSRRARLVVPIEGVHCVLGSSPCSAAYR